MERNSVLLLMTLVMWVPAATFAQQQFPYNPASGSTPKSVGSSADLTNVRVIELTKIGLDDDIIIAKIKNGVCRFDLADSDLLDLKKAGVSSKVVAAMLDASALLEPRV